MTTPPLPPSIAEIVVAFVYGPLDDEDMLLLHQCLAEACRLQREADNAGRTVLVLTGPLVVEPPK